MEHRASAGKRANVDSPRAAHANSGEIVRPPEVGGVDVMFKRGEIFMNQVQRPEGQRIEAPDHRCWGSVPRAKWPEGEQYEYGGHQVAIGGRYRESFQQAWENELPSGTSSR